MFQFLILRDKFIYILQIQNPTIFRLKCERFGLIIYAGTDGDNVDDAEADTNFDRKPKQINMPHFVNR